MAFGMAKGVKTPSQDPRYDALDGTAPANAQRWGKNGAPIQQKSDPYWDQQAGQSALDQEAAGKQQQQAYDIMHAQALGGATAAQGMLQSGTATQHAALTGLAAGAGGGARGAAAAQGTALGATANAGMMGARRTSICSATPTCLPGRACRTRWPARCAIRTSATWG